MFSMLCFSGVALAERLDLAVAEEVEQVVQLLGGAQRGGVVRIELSPSEQWKA